MDQLSPQRQAINALHESAIQTRRDLLAIRACKSWIERDGLLRTACERASQSALLAKSMLSPNPHNRPVMARSGEGKEVQS